MIKITVIVVLAIIIGFIISELLESLHDRIIYRRLKLINRYQKILEKDDIAIKCKGKTFYTLVDYCTNTDPVYTCTMYVNNENVLVAYELNHGSTNSYQLEYNENRSYIEVDKLIKLTYKKYKRLYYDKYLKVDFSFTSFWED